MVEPALIGVDWGTSSLRAALIGDDGSVLGTQVAEAGILSVTDGDFAAALRAAMAALEAPVSLPVVLSGMITSRQGWHELPYLPCPAGADDLAGAIHHTRAPGLGPLHFVTGLSSRQPDGTPDVMRGEETQIVGQDDLAPGEAVVLPGTHSKWVVVEDGRIIHFRTYLTGELFAVLARHSILGRLMADGPADEEAFLRGVEVALAGPGLLGRLFSARALPLMGPLRGGLAETAVRDYLSGLLIGTEIAEELAAERPEAVVVIGNDQLARRYAAALDRAGLQHRPGRPDAAALGQWRIAEAAGIIG